MKHDFVITGIDRIILVGKEEYPEEKTSFSTEVICNELIFHFSGDMTNYFDDQVFEVKAGTVRFLPKGHASRYDVVRRESGECVDVFFSTDRPVADRAFILDVYFFQQAVQGIYGNHANTVCKKIPFIKIKWGCRPNAKCI